MRAAGERAVAELTRADRGQVIAALERAGDELAQISTWLSRADEDKAAILLEEAWRDVSAAGWVLERPVRVKPEGWLTG
jgi:hypothetical protein